jgi:hypothetical protein
MGFGQPVERWWRPATAMVKRNLRVIVENLNGLPNSDSPVSALMEKPAHARNGQPSARLQHPNPKRRPVEDQRIRW